MLDDLRNSSSYIEDEPDAKPPVDNYQPARRRQKETFLGMTAIQRFIISLILFLLVCVLGTFALLFTNSIALPF